MTVHNYTIGSYQLIDEIDSGGMGTVWRARRADGLIERDVAIKFINLGMQTASVRERFARERQILATLSHPHIARLYDAGISETGQPYLVLELVDGEPIDAYCNRHQLDLNKRISLFQQVLEAVAHAHQHLVVHRDIKPSNILVSAAGEVKLLDFGVSKLLDESADANSGLTRDGGRMITPEYAAPEQLSNRPITTAADVYSLGVLLFRLLTGAMPYSVANASPATLARAIMETPAARASRIVSAEAGMLTSADSVTTQTRSFLRRRFAPFSRIFSSQSARICAAGTSENAAEITDSVALRARERNVTPSKLAAQLRGDLDTILAKSLRKDPLERYASVNALADDLQSYREHKPIRARPESLAYVFRRFTQRHRAAVLTGAFALIAIIASTLVVIWQAHEARTQAQIAALEASKANAIRDYLVGLFRAVGRDAVEFPQRGDTPARELLDRATANINAELSQHPEVRAYLQETFSNLYFDLDESKRSLAVARNWEALAARDLPPNHPALVRALVQQGVALTRMDDIAQATDVLNRARTLLVNQPKGEDWVRTHLAIASLMSNEFRHAEAEQALAEAKSVAVVSPQLEADRLYENAAVIFRAGKLADAQALMEQAKERYAKLYGTESMRTAEAQWQLGTIYLYRANWPAAEAALEAALPAIAKQKGRVHRDAMWVLRELAYVKARQGKMAEANQLIDEAEAAARGQRDEPGMLARLGGILLVSGRILMLEGDVDAAHARFVESYDLHKRAGTDDVFLAFIGVDLALTTALRGNIAEGEKLAAESAARIRERQGANSQAYQTALIGQARVLGLSDKARARQLLDQAAAMQIVGLVYPSGELAAHILAADLAATDKDVAGARAHVEAARKIAATRAAFPEVQFQRAKTDVQLAELAQWRGEVCASLAEARRIIRDFQVPNGEWRVRVEQAIKRCRV